MGAPRTNAKKSWPRGMYEPRPGYYVYRSPVSGKSVAIGSVPMHEAFAVVRKLNHAADSIALDATVKKLRRAHVPTDESGLTDGAHITKNAAVYQRLCGVYFLLLGAEIVYVGQSNNVLMRLASHQTRGEIEFDRFFIERCSQAQVANLEAMYIAKFKPRHNIACPTPKPEQVQTSEALSAMFGAAIHVRDL
jgi:hypothetical protein